MSAAPGLITGPSDTAIYEGSSRARDPLPRGRPLKSSLPTARTIRWSLLSLVIGLLLAAPAGFVIAEAVRTSSDVLSHALSPRLPAMLLTTAVLCLAVVSGSLLLGGTLAWLVSNFEFPSRKLVGWALALPLAIPAYVMGFAFLSVSGHGGPAQSALRRLPGMSSRFVDVQGLIVATFILTLSFYPYVYLLARAGMSELSPRMLEVARSLGYNDRRLATRLVLPMLRPHLAAGAALVAMETLTDFATVRLFGVGTLADGMMRVWFDLADRPSAMSLGSALLGAGVLVVLLERFARRRQRFGQPQAPLAQRSLRKLKGTKAAIASLYCYTIVALALIGPLCVLVYWAAAALGKAAGAQGGGPESQTMTAVGTPSGGFFYHLGVTVALASIAALFCVGLATVIVNVERLAPSPLSRLGTRLATVGYALPGAVVAAGSVVFLAALDRMLATPSVGRPLLLGSVGGLLFGYAARFTAIPTYSAEAGLGRIKPEMSAVARTLGTHPAIAAIRVHLPLMRPSLVAGALLVFVDVVKELPLTLILRPFGVETLAVWVWRNTSVSAWEPAGVPALTMVALCLAATTVVLRYLSRGETVPT